MPTFFSNQNKVRVVILWAQLRDAAIQLQKELEAIYGSFCEFKTIRDVAAVTGRFDDRSESAIREADRILMVAHQEGWEGAVYARQEFDFFQRLVSERYKDENQLRFVQVGEKQCPSFHTAGRQVLKFSDGRALTERERARFYEWLDVARRDPAVHFQVPEFDPADLHPREKAFVASLLWLIGFDQRVWSRDVLEAVSTGELARAAFSRNLRTLKALHTIHSTIGPTVHSLMSESVSGSPLPADLALSERRRRLAKAFANQAPDWKRQFQPNLHACLREGVVPNLKNIEARLLTMGRTGREIAFVSTTTAILSSLYEPQSTAPSVPIFSAKEWIDGYRLCREVVSAHDSGFLVRPATYSGISSGSSRGEIQDFWRHALMDSHDFYGSLVDFAFVISSLFHFLRIYKAEIPSAELPIEIGSLFDMIEELQRNSTDVVDSVVKWSNNLILAHIEAATPLFEAFDAAA